VTAKPGSAVDIDLTRGAKSPAGYPLSVVSATASHGKVSSAKSSARQVAPAARITPAAYVVSTAVVSTGDVSSSGTVTYTPAKGWRGVDTLHYVLGDGHGGTVSGSVRITTPNTAPVAKADTFHLTWKAGESPATLDVLANDTDANGDHLHITHAFGESTQGGRITFTGSTLHYTPRPGFTGTDTASYVISDGHGGTAHGEVTIVVSEAATPPLVTLTINGDHNGATPTGTAGSHWVAGGIPAGKSATFTLQITDFSQWSFPLIPINGATCSDHGIDAASTETLVCTVTANGEFLHADFDATGPWTITGTLTPNGYAADPATYTRSGTAPAVSPSLLEIVI